MPFRRCWIRSLPLVLLLLLPALGASAANWLDLQQAGGVAYFFVLQSTTPSIERLQMDGSPTGARLPSIKLSTSPSPPSAFFVTPGGTIYVAYSNRIDQIDDTGKVVVTIPITEGAQALYGTQDFLFVVRSTPTGGTTVQPVDLNKKTAGVPQQTSTRQDFGFVFARPTTGDPTHGQVFAFGSLTASSLLVTFEVGEDSTGNATVGTAVEAPISTPVGAARLFPFADDTRVADASGTVYSATDAMALDSFGGAVTSLAFRGDVPIVLRGAQIVSFTNTLDQAKLKTLPVPGPSDPPLPSAILVQGDFVYAFSDDNNQTSGVPNVFSARSFSLVDDLDLKGTPEPNQPIIPVEPTTGKELTFTPTGVAFDATDGTLYLLDSADLRLFRWSTSTMNYLDTVVLTDTPRFLAVSHANGQIYLGYSGGAVKQLAIVGATSNPDLLDVKAPLCGLVTTDPVATDAALVTCQKGPSAGTASTTGAAASPAARRGGRGGTASGVYTSFDVNGKQLAQVTAPVGDGLIWSPAAESLYFLVGSGASRGARGTQIAALPLAAGGTFGTLVTGSVSSRTSRTQTSSSVLPIATTADGSRLVLGSGQELDAQNLHPLSDRVPAPNAAGPMVDGATAGSDLWTFRGIGGGAEADRIQSDNSLASRALFEGAPLRLFAMGSGDLVTLANVGGVPTPTLWTIASAQPLVGHLRFASTSATPLFDLAAVNYSQAGSNSELTFPEIDMTPAGQVTASGQIQFLVKTPPETVNVGLSGSLAGSGSSIDANLRFSYDGTLNGQPYTGTATMKLTGFNAATNALTGTQTVNLTIGRQRVNNSGSATWILPQGVDGSWTLDVLLDAPVGGTITGSAVLHVHPVASAQVTPARDLDVALSGTFDSTTGHATLSGSSAELSLSLTDLAPLARGAEGTVALDALGQSRSAVLDGSAD